MRKLVEAEHGQAPSVEVWGTGKPIREFIYVEDCADAIVLAAEKYNDVAMPLNIGTGIGTTIRELVRDGLRGRPATRARWSGTPTSPTGRCKKVLDVTRMKQALDGWTPPTDLRDGPGQDVAWYRANKAQADAKW